MVSRPMRKWFGGGGNGLVGVMMSRPMRKWLGGCDDLLAGSGTSRMEDGRGFSQVFRCLSVFLLTTDPVENKRGGMAVKP